MDESIVNQLYFTSHYIEKKMEKDNIVRKYYTKYHNNE